MGEILVMVIVFFFAKRRGSRDGTSATHKLRSDVRLKGMRTATFQFAESGGSLNGPDLFTELPFL